MSVLNVSFFLRALCALTLNHKRGSFYFQIFYLLSNERAQQVHVTGVECTVSVIISQQASGSTIVVNVRAMRRVTTAGLFERSDFLGYTSVNTKIV